MKISEIQSRIFEVIDGLDNIEGDAKQAIEKARVKLFGYRAVAATIREQLDHAVRTERLVNGSDVLPDMTIGGASAVVPESTQPAARTAGRRQVG